LMYDTTIQYNQVLSTRPNLGQPKSGQLCNHSIEISILVWDKAIGKCINPNLVSFVTIPLEFLYWYRI
jgi:hypothetical protein